jgi:hypothetical protein
MVFALAGVLIALVVTGLLTLGGEEKQGPLAAVVGYSLGSAAKPVHRWLTMLLLGMVALHVAGVLVESALTHDNLVRAMITGWKRLPVGAPRPAPRPARPVLAGAMLALLVAAAAGTLHWLSRLPAPPGLRALPPNALYQKECGACHHAFHPALLPASSWTAIMVSLRDHFGDDASLGAATTASLASWLATNSAETFDTESAHRLRLVAPDDPLRITSAPYWVRKHADIPPDVFARKGVGGKVNCHACHRDAGSGRYDDQAIAVPKE